MNKKPFNALNDCFVRYLFTDKGGEKVLLDFINAVMISADMKTFKSWEKRNLSIWKSNNAWRRKKRGIKERVKKEIILIVKDIKTKNMDINLISEITGLSIDKIRKL